MLEYGNWSDSDNTGNCNCLMNNDWGWHQAHVWTTAEGMINVPLAMKDGVPSYDQTRNIDREYFLGNPLIIIILTNYIENKLLVGEYLMQTNKKKINK